MARGKRGGQDGGGVGDGIGDGFVEVTPQELATYETIAALREQCDDNEQGIVRINKRLPDGRLVGYPSLPALTFDPDLVVKKYGGGKYFVRFFKGREHLGDANFEFSESIKPEPEVVAVPAAVVPHDQGGGRLEGELSGLRMVVESQSRMVSELLSALVKGGVGNGGNHDTRDPLEVGLKIAELIKGDGGNERMGVQELAATFREGMQLGREIVNPERADSFADVVAPFVPIVKSTLEDYMENEKRKTGAAGAPPASVKADGAAAALTPPKQEITVDLTKAPWLAHLAPFLGEIQTWAKNGWDAQAYVGSMLARMPDHIIDEIEVASREEQFVENALAALPAPFLAYKGWLTLALDTLREEVKPNEETPS